jgi:arylsulfatase A-like enzyme
VEKVRPVKSALLVVVVFCLLVGHAGAAAPNIVVFIADDLGWADCSSYGGNEVPTPNMARLARDGITLTHAFVASPSCAPSRAALLTGLDPMRNGAMLNHSRPRADVKKWPAHFKELGYDVVSFGKVAHYAQVMEYGFDQASHYRYHEDDCVEAAVKWLAVRKPDKPLCLMVGSNWPHVPWPKESPLDPATLKLPPTLVDTKETRQARARYLAAVANADRDLGLVYDATGKHLGKDTLFLFSSDHGSQFPFGKWNAYDAGIRTPLIAAWPGRIKPGTTAGAMVSWIDILPTCIEAAGGRPPEGLSGKSFLGVILGEKATHRDKVFITHSADGNMNRYPLRAVRTRDWKYIRNLDPGAQHHTHVDLGKAATDGRDYWDSWVRKSDPAAAAIVRRYHTRPAEELYDLTGDPWELKNLAADPAYGDRLKALRTDLDAWMKDQGDKGLATERALPDPQSKSKGRP